jgi:hypothetical protein
MNILPTQTELLVFQIEMALRSGCKYFPMTNYNKFKIVYYRFFLYLSGKSLYIRSKLKPLGYY